MLGLSIKGLKESWVFLNPNIVTIQLDGDPTGVSTSKGGVQEGVAIFGVSFNEEGVEVYGFGGWVRIALVSRCVVAIYHRQHTTSSLVMSIFPQGIILTTHLFFPLTRVRFAFHILPIVGGSLLGEDIDMLVGSHRHSVGLKESYTFHLVPDEVIPKPIGIGVDEFIAESRITEVKDGRMVVLG